MSEKRCGKIRKEIMDWAGNIRKHACEQFKNHEGRHFCHCGYNWKLSELEVAQYLRVRA